MKILIEQRYFQPHKSTILSQKNFEFCIVLWNLGDEKIENKLQKKMPVVLCQIQIVVQPLFPYCINMAWLIKKKKKNVNLKIH